MTPDEHVAVLRAEGMRLAAMPPDALGAPVPTVPGWTLERVIRHTGKVHRWVTGVLAAGPGATLAGSADAPPLPHGPGCLPAYRESLDALLAELSGSDVDRAAPTLTGPGTVRFWARRQAHEVTVHRVDAADAVHAAGGRPPAPVDPRCAADGVDEWARLMLPRAVPQIPNTLHGKSVHLHGTDTPDAELLLAFGADGVRVEAGHGRSTVAIRGTAEDLLLTMWRRRPLAALEMVGDADVARRMIDAARI
ncbi:maleylpyruvate isomerase N-terminal domain-containing protein [Rhodococcus sp. NPDC058505]|uniref:maleylpyruvate isomerase N-terminal domain-containing protein n=1 Tax=Rhodococcus sp. NPDC058505 TaxID=3346531 RepID=UPI003663E241